MSTEQSLTSESLSEEDRRRYTEERDHLLVSLDDLDAELAAGDIDELDYATLRDDYTARTAKLTRVLEGAPVRRTRAARVATSRRAVWIVSVLAIAGLAAWAMVQFSGARGVGEPRVAIFG